MAWIAAHPYLSSLALIVVGGSISTWLFWLSDRDHRAADQPAIGRATAPEPGTVARHRAGAVQRVDDDHSPLDSWVRQGLAPTANENTALPAGPGEHTARLDPPRRNHPMGGTR